MNKAARLSVLLFCLGIFFLQNNADARKRGIPFLFTTGEAFKDIKQATAEDIKFLIGGDVDTSQIPANMKVSLKYSHFGIFFMNVWTWGGEIVLYDGGDQYFFIEIDQQKALDKYGTPFLYKFPRRIGAGMAPFNFPSFSSTSSNLS